MAAADGAEKIVPREERLSTSMPSPPRVVFRR
jgi:hypothetical protein